MAAKEPTKEMSAPRELPLLTGHDVEGLRQWIKALCEFLRTSPTKLARLAQLAPSTLNRFVKTDADVKHRLSATTIAKVQEAAERLAANPSLLTPPTKGVTSQLHNKKPTKVISLSPYRKTISVRVVGRVQAGLWREAMEWPADEQYFAPMLIRGVPDVRKVFGLEVSGPSMNEIYPHGSIVACVKLIDLERHPRSGERVVVQRRQANGLIESTINELLIDAQGRAWLMPKSSDPEYQAGWRVDAASLRDGDDDIVVTAVVVGSFRPEPQFS